VGPAENVDCTDYRPKAAIYKQHDADNDAIYVWLVLFNVSQWFSPLLAGFQYNYYRNSVFHYRWLGLPEISLPNAIRVKAKELKGTMEVA